MPCGAANVSAEECGAVQCCYDGDSGECYHYIPSKYYYYRADGGLEAVRVCGVIGIVG